MFLIGCGTAPDRQAPHSVTDSAGVTIVESSAPEWSEEAEWRISAEPYLEVGSVDGEEPYLLQGVRAVTTLSDGRVAVAMSGDNTIRFYDAQGRYLSRVGGRGGGPGEFSSIISLHRSGGRLYGGQPRGRPINVFDEASGDFLDGISPPATLGADASFQGVFDDGSLIFRLDVAGEVPTSGTYEWQATLVRLQPSREVDTLGVFPAQTFVVPQPQLSTAQHYGPNLEVAVGQSEAYVGHSSRYMIFELGPDGEVRSSIRSTTERRPVTQDDVRRRKDESLSRGASRDDVDAMIYPDHHPAFEQVLLARSGHLWVQRHDPLRTRMEEVMGTPDDTPAPWDVFSAERIWLGTVEQPPRLRIMEIGEDYVAGVWVDDLGVEFVRFFEIIKPVG